MGTCAGTLLLAKKVINKGVNVGQFTLGLMDISIVRDIFGRYKNSFVAEVNLENMGTVKAAFIRSPGIVEAWGSARIVGYLEHPVVGKVGVAAVQDNPVALAFHPEITGEKKYTTTCLPGSLGERFQTRLTPSVRDPVPSTLNVICVVFRGTFEGLGYFN
ncbi:MAG: hypothetical protein QXH02_07335 [Desulfurococcaceae archaeon]